MTALVSQSSQITARLSQEYVRLFREGFPVD